MWVPPEDKDPVLLHAPTRKSVACFGAVSLRTGKLVTTFEPKFNAESFQRFLQLLLIHRPRGKRLTLVLDNAKYHHARALQPWLHQHRKRLTLILATLQPRAQSDRTGLEADAPIGHPQSALPNARRHPQCRTRALRALGKTESSVATVMRHYLSRYV